MKNKRLFGSLMLLLAAMIWGFGFSAQSVLGQALPTFTVVCLKNAGGFLLIPIAYLLKQKYTKDVWVGGILCGLFQAVACLTQQRGIEMTTVGKASFITALYIVFVPLLYVLMGRKSKINVWLGVAIAAVGMYFLCINESFFFSKGDILVTICAVCLAGQIIVIDRYVQKADPVPLASIQALTVCAFGFIGMLIEKPEISAIVNNWPSLLYAAVMSCGVACTLQIIYQKDVEASLASLLMSFESVFGVIGGFLFLNQILSFRELIGCALIFIAVLIAQKE